MGDFIDFCRSDKLRNSNERSATDLTDEPKVLNSNPNASTSAFIPAPVAICGIALRLPGGINDASTFWNFLLSGNDARIRIPETRYNIEGFDDKCSKKGAIKTHWGYFIDEDLSCLDTSFFSLSKEELKRTDPQQRQLLEVVHECLENAGEVNYRGKSIGCYVGTFGEDWLRMSSMDSQYSGRYTLTGYNDLMIANRVSYEYNLKGPSVVIKTGCSASLVALHQACRALQTGDCEAALVAGTNLIMEPTMTASMTSEGILSPDGSCKTFDATANGFARGEAINAIYIKLLDDAIRDGNPIRAVIRNTATNSDGKSSSLTAPNGQSHEDLMRKVYAGCALNPKDTPFVECHGTGTVIGDPIETTAVGNIFGGEKEILIGSVKPNVGHSEGASGITSLIKAILALEHETIPPNIKFHHPNPNIPFRERNLRVPTEALPWPVGRPKRISVNSFGIGGTNAHVIVESFGARQDSETSSKSASAALFLFSANNLTSLNNRISDHLLYANAHPEKVNNIAYTLAARREHLPYRSYAIAREGHSPHIHSSCKVPPASKSVIMVFSGQGAQWPRMGRELMQSDPEFLQDIRLMDAALQSSMIPPGWTIESEIQLGSETSGIHRAELSQPICAAIQVALVNVFLRSEVRPVAVIGHSSGEIAAAYACGALTLQQAILTAYYRGHATLSQSLKGAMAAVGMGRNEMTPFLRKGTVIACENSPKSVTISGDADQIHLCVSDIQKTRPDVLVRLLRINQAYHSDHMKSLAGRYHSLLSEVFRDTTISSQLHTPFFSSVTAKRICDSRELNAQYWQDNLESPVLFGPAVTEALQKFAEPLFLEIGPHSTLAGPLRQICVKAGTVYSYIPSMLRHENCEESLLSAFGQLYQNGCTVLFEKVISSRQIVTDMPNYPWDHSTSYWHENRISKEWRLRKFRNHGLLGARVQASSDLLPMWRNVLDLEDESWLSDHKIGGDTVFPFAGYCAMAGEAFRQISAVQNGYSLRNIKVQSALLLEESQPVEIITTLRPWKLDDDDHDFNSECWEFCISSYSSSVWREHCKGLVKNLADGLIRPAEPEQSLRKVKPSRWYESMANSGLVYGPSFQGLASISSSTTEHRASALINTPFEYPISWSFLHPTTIDACFQLSLVAFAKGIGRNCARLLPVSVEELDISHKVENLHATAEVSVFDEKVKIWCGGGTSTALRLQGLRFKDMSESTDVSGSDPYAAARLEWRPHFDFIDHSSLFQPLSNKNKETKLFEEYTYLCMIDSVERLGDTEASKPHLVMYLDWMRAQIEQISRAPHVILGDTNHLLSLDRATRKEHINELSSRLPQFLGNDTVALAVGVRRIWENIESLIAGSTDTLNLLMEDNVLARIYNTVGFDHSRFIQLLSHSNPNLRILEVGAGTGGTTQTFLNDLLDENKTPQYSLYMFTDVSAGFFPAAKERFSFAPNLDFKVFDISVDAFEQGFEASSFDLILAPNVVHATPVLKATLKNLEKLLKPDGKLVLTELVSQSNTPNYVFGNFSGWWLGREDGRRDEPYISVDRWDLELKGAGFTGVDTVVYDGDYPNQYCAAMVSHPALRSTQKTQKNKVTILSSKPNQDPGRTLIQDLQEAGFEVTVQDLEKDLSSCQPIISILDYESEFFATISHDNLSNFQKLLAAHQSQQASLLWLTRPAQVACQYPQTALSIGMGKSIRAELDSQFVTFEIEPTEVLFAESVLKVLRYVQKTRSIETMLPDREFAFHQGTIMVGRYHTYDFKKALLQARETNQKAIEYPTKKKLDYLELNPTASYLLTGGLGGLGRALARWMVERGAKSLIFLSPRAGQSTEDTSFIRELESMDCEVSAVRGQAEDMCDVERAIRSTDKPIRGIIHLAMVLRDNSVMTMSHAEFHAAVAPKVQGAWNLHYAMEEQPQTLDFFVLASSLFTVIEHPGQCNYNAGSMFLEAFCQFRRLNNRPASVVNISPISDIGFVSQDAQISRNLKSTGLYFQREEHLLDFFELAMLSSQAADAMQNGNDMHGAWKPWINESQYIMGLRSQLPLSDPKNRIEWRRDRRMALYHNETSTAEALDTLDSSDELAAFLARANDDPSIVTDADSVELLGVAIGKKILELTLNTDRELQLDLTLDKMGLDSLTAMELKRWWKGALGDEISVLEIVGAGVLRSLGERARRGLEARLQSAA
ncbi:polyketide synthase protein [Rutstroemia sp. NJR-2017a WRK4]|nr:polyketide synthase protein [Rutstroemia sp. NJR-2017a WRK4]